MDERQQRRLFQLLSPIYELKSKESVSDWCARNVIFDEPKLNGPFSFAGREYMREMLDCWSNPFVKDIIFCMGTRTGKTRVLMGGAMWRIRNSPMRCLWTLPATDGPGGARSFSMTRFQPAIRASPVLAPMIPTGTQRYMFKATQLIINGSIIDFTGTGSPKQLGGNPCDVTIQDEVDGQMCRGDAEAHPSILIDQRTKEFSNPKRIKTSTPTLETGVIWQELLKTDLRRRFVPCPHCNKFVVFAWSSQFTILAKTGAEAYVTWDKEAKRKNGTWDLDRVVASARAQCPFCGGHILDTHKTRIDRAGEWRSTRQAAPGYVGFHLPSMYSVGIETSFGQMAKRFLLFKQGLQGMKGFINSDLAEPDLQQELQSERVELVTKAETLKEKDVPLLLTCDVQMRAPFRWVVVRRWNKGNSEGIFAGHCDGDDEVRDIQLRYGIPDSAVMLDSGFGAKSGDAGIYRVCAEHSEIIEGFRENKQERLCLGWVPAKGQGEYKRWHDKETGNQVPYRMVRLDPFLGTSEAGLVQIELFEFSASFFKDILDTLRKGKSHYTWSVLEEVATPEYWKHLSGQHKMPIEHKVTHIVRPEWVKRSRHWPDHLFSCEVMQVSFAAYLGLFSIDAKEKGAPTETVSTAD